VDGNQAFAASAIMTVGSGALNERGGNPREWFGSSKQLWDLLAVAQKAGDGCGRPHGQMVYHFGDGHWWDAEVSRCRDGWGRRIRIATEADILGHIRQTRVVLATAHRDHDTSNNADANLNAFCQRCHMIQDRPENRQRCWRTLLRRKALGNLFDGQYL